MTNKSVDKGIRNGKMYISNKKRENSSLFVDKQRNVWYNKT